MLDLNKVLLVLLLALSQPALSQQVYETKDAEGNVSFSDQPSEGAETVDIPTPNLSDSVKVPPPSADPTVTEPTNATPNAPASGNQQNTEEQQEYIPAVDELPENIQGDIDEVERRQDHHYNYVPHREPRGGR